MRAKLVHHSIDVNDGVVSKRAQPRVVRRSAPRFTKPHLSVSSELFAFLKRHHSAPGQITLVAHQQLHPA